jgi:predicted NodU family carbamoyl transferase
MHVLGVKTTGHDTGAAILSEIDGEITCIAIAEARLNREKASGRFPVLSINYCLSAAGLASMDDCDIVVVDRLNENQPPSVRQARMGDTGDWAPV